MNLKENRPGQRGSILIVAVWMLGLLFLLTISLSRRTNQQLLLVKYSLQKMQARYLAWAGFEYALEKIREDSLDEKSKLFDNLYACGAKIPEGRTPEDVFKNVLLSQGSFEITTLRKDGDNFKTVFGLGDEDGKLNLNALTLENYTIFKELLMIAGVSEKQAQQIAGDTLDWKDEDTQAVLSDKNTPEGPYSWLKQTVMAKNRPLDSRGELRFINGMTDEIYEKIKDWVTVFPRRADRLQINFATAPREVLLALTRHYAGPLTNTSKDDADNLANKILIWREGEDKIEGTLDDRLLDETKLNLTMPEENILRALSPIKTEVSRFLTVHATGIDASKARKSHIDAVVDRQTLNVVSWRAD